MSWRTYDARMVSRIVRQSAPIPIDRVDTVARDFLFQFDGPIQKVGRLFNQTFGCLAQLFGFATKLPRTWIVLGHKDSWVSAMRICRPFFASSIA